MTEQEKKVIKRLAKQAATLLKTSGWIQNTFGDVKIGFCLLGAINYVTKRAVSSSERSARNKLVGRLQRRTAHNIAAWNDRKGRTRSEVLKLLRDSVPR